MAVRFSSDSILILPVGGSLLLARVEMLGRGGAGRTVKPAQVKERELMEKLNAQAAMLRRNGMNETEIALWRIGKIEGKTAERKARADVQRAGVA